MTRPLFATLCGLTLFIAATTAQASPITYTALPFTGDNAKVTITLTQLASNSVQVSLAVDTSVAIADLRGFFFNLSDNNTAGLTFTNVSGAPVTTVVINPGNVTSAGGGGNNINPEGPFDVGIELGNPGIGGGDDFQTSVFKVTRTAGGLLSAMTSETDPGPNELLFAVRVTSVGENRQGSSKLGVSEGPIIIVPDPDVVPEPATIAVLGAMTGLGALGYRVRRKNRAAE